MPKLKVSTPILSLGNNSISQWIFNAFCGPNISKKSVTLKEKFAKIQ